MRIRRRPQQPSSAGSDLAAASTAPPTPLNAARNRGWLLAGGEDEEDREAKPKLLHAGSADLVLGQKSGVARRLALPQDDNVAVVDCGRSGVGGAQRHGADDDGRMRFSAANGHGDSEEHKDGGGATTCTGGVGEGGRYEPVVKADEERRVTSNGFVQPPAASALASAPATVATPVVKDEGKKQQQATSNGNGTGGAKKRRGPAVLLEGSRCSRVNGRGWRCSQPTLVGYSLCEHHLGKGRMRSAAAAAAARSAGGGGNAGVGRLGRTEHGARTIAAAVGAASGVVTAAAVAPAPKAEGPSLPGC